MKTLILLCLFVILSGCGWMNNNQKQDGNMNDNQNGQQETVKTSQMKDLFAYFDEQGITYSNAQDLKTMNINAHEGKMFEYEGNPVYIYRMNMSDANMKSWMDEIKNTGKVTINQDGKDDNYDAIINGEYLLVTKSNTNLNKLSEMFKNYQIK